MCDMCGPMDQVTDHSIKHPFVLKPDTDLECLTCGKHVSAHPDKREYLAKREMEAIIEHGHQVRVVFPDESGGYMFAYSIGRSLKERPEILVTGALPPPMLGYIVNRVAELDDERGIAAGDVLNDVLEGYPVRLVAVADMEQAEMFGVTANFGTDDTFALQVLWPDAEGRFPGEPEYAYGDKQPVFA